MGILLTKVRISNFRSIENMAVDLGMMNLLVGQNNTGKSNFLRAINIALAGAADVSETDIFIAADERLEKIKTAIIDIMINPIDDVGTIVKDFSDFWTGVFTEAWITTHPEGNFVGIRTEIKFNLQKDIYIIDRRCINQWGDSVATAQLNIKKLTFNEEMRDFLQTSYMDANRDIVQDLRNRRSYFGRVTSNYDMTDESVQEIEEQLSSINSMIVESAATLRQTKERLAAIGQTIGDSSSSVEIEPLARKITDLNKGMDIIIKDGNAASFPISQHGSGTRSWISFLTLSAYVEHQNEKRKADDAEAEQYFMLTMEEPEAHLHPQAQRQLFSQMAGFTGQKIISTHSPSIVAHAALTDAIHFSKRDGKTSAVRYKPEANPPGQDGSSIPDDKIAREVINTRADILFASAVVLCEGITEELALPVFFQKFFGYSPFTYGVNFIGIGGQNYKSYLSLIKDFDIPWFIFSDGEESIIKSVKIAVGYVYNKDYSCLKNVVILDNGNNYEKYLIQEGYAETIIAAICEYHNNDKVLEDYIARMKNQKATGGVPRDYEDVEGRKRALIDLCISHKTEYALPVARKIVTMSDVSKQIPEKIEALFSALAMQLGIEVATVVEETS